MHCAFFHFVSAPPLKPQYASYLKKSKRINKSQIYENFEVDKSIYFNVKPSQRHAYRLSYIKEIHILKTYLEYLQASGLDSS